MTTTTTRQNNVWLRHGWLPLLTIVLSSIFRTTSAQATCSCAPSAYTWRFDFSLSCPPPAIDEDAAAGIDELTCTTTLGNGTTDGTPSRVTFVQFLDINEDNTVASQSEMTGEFVSGSTVSFTSITSLGNITGGIQLNMNAFNALNQTVTQTFLIVFSNDCETYPVFEQGDSLGWLVFESFSEPRDELCPASPQTPSSVPSSSPSDAPLATPEPTPSPTVPPTTSPVAPTPPPVAPTPPPVPVTPAPVAPADTPAPTGGTPAPIVPPTGGTPAPIVPPTGGTPAPIVPPPGTPAPTPPSSPQPTQMSPPTVPSTPSPSAMSMSMSMSMSMMTGGAVRFLEELFVASEWVEFGRPVEQRSSTKKKDQQQKPHMMRLRR